MKNLIEITKHFRKNKSAIEAGGLSVVVKIAITLIVGGLFFWLVWKMIVKYI